MENVEFRKHIKEKQEHNNIDSQIQKKTQNVYDDIFTTDESEGYERFECRFRTHHRRKQILRAAIICNYMSGGILLLVSR